MAAITIDLASPVPAYRQIASALRALLVTGDLAPGCSTGEGIAKIPVVRSPPKPYAPMRASG